MTNFASRFLPRKHTPPPGWKNPLAQQHPLNSLPWIGAAVFATLLFAVLCVYITFCLLFWQGQWQLVFKPSRTITASPASAGLVFQEIAFDAKETGALQLHGWWIPASNSDRTLLLMHDGFGSLSDSLPQLEALHALGINVFAFDYRGFGESEFLHPSEKTTTEDADAAWNYLTTTRHLSPDNIVLDGVGLGAAIATEIARRHPNARALVLEWPRPPVMTSLHLDPRTRWLPVSLLFQDRFDPTATLARLATPKLLLCSPSGPHYEEAAQPKQITLLEQDYTSEQYLESLRAFVSAP